MSQRFPLLRGPKMTPVFRSERKATAYAQREANKTGQAMGVFKEAPGCYTIKAVKSHWTTKAAQAIDD